MRGRPKLPIGSHGTIHVSQQGDVWRARCNYRDTDGETRRVAAFAPTSSKAQLRLQEKLKNRGRVGGEEVTKHTTIAELSLLWLRTLTQSAATADQYQDKVDKHIVPALGELAIHEATTGRLESFLRALQSKTPTTARMTRTVLSLMLGMAVRHDAISVNPVGEVLLATQERVKVTALSVDDVHALREDVDKWAKERPGRDQVRDAVDVLLATGLRPGELLALRFSDIDYKANTIEVTGTVKRDSVNGLHRQEYPKSESGKRVLTLPYFGIKVLRRRRLSAKSDLVFASRSGAVMEPSNFRRQWREARGDKWDYVQPRSFRKAVATLIERESGSIAASLQLGHSSDAVTKRHYIARDKKAPDASSTLDQWATKRPVPS
ncbi:hypothetical protein MB46_10245 [Arthrobacter alpinus]|uniref:tyrosine-type recombinase/integrase n=1 Tax=Arthrobacter alpinus TaxID=656366 RepID=UPI00067845AD|nr:site-specific integrase [Arthrobacter alpinus]ALV45801.1 hypothetical protein MB46_10245 [Arthrobacter alpinus]